MFALHEMMSLPGVLTERRTISRVDTLKSRILTAIVQLLSLRLAILGSVLDLFSLLLDVGCFLLEGLLGFLSHSLVFEFTCDNIAYMTWRYVGFAVFPIFFHDALRLSEPNRITEQSQFKPWSPYSRSLDLLACFHREREEASRQRRRIDSRRWARKRVLVLYDQYKP